jgi:SAM-dependent methyltransferase
MNRKTQTRPLYQQQALPILQNRMYDTRAEAVACPKGDVVLVEDLRTGFVSNAAFRPELVVYDAHYQNEQALSASFQEHLTCVSSILERHLGRAAIIEIGCGKGSFLEMLLANGFDVTGFDPTYEGRNPRVRKQYFGPGVGIRGDGVVLRHVLEHIHNPYEFLLQLKEANGGGGRIYIEVPLLDWICEHRAWFDIFYEHVNYFRISDFYRMFGAIVESGRLFGGQYLYVVAELSTLRMPEIDPMDRIEFPQDFARTLSGERAAPSRAAIWGGASKGVIFALLKARAGQHIDTVIDINPAKQGKYLPATGMLVQSAVDGLRGLPGGSTIYVMNSNYLDEVVRMSNNAYTYVGVDHE